MVEALRKLNVRRLHFSEALLRVSIVRVQFVAAGHRMLVRLCMCSVKQPFLVGYRHRRKDCRRS